MTLTAPGCWDQAEVCIAPHVPRVSRSPEVVRGPNPLNVGERLRETMQLRRRKHRFLFPREGEGCRVVMRSGRQQSTSGGGRRWWIVASTRSFLIPDGWANAVKYLTCQTREVTKGETGRVQWDVGPAARVSSTSSRRLDGFAFYFINWHLCMCCHPRRWRWWRKYMQVFYFWQRCRAQLSSKPLLQGEMSKYLFIVLMLVIF